MHNKFVLIDGSSVWTGSMNLTVNGVDRHNNNLLELRSAEAARRYQAEFDEMFAQGRFGPRSPQGETAPVETETGRIAIYFGPEDDLAAALVDALAGAQNSIRFMAFSFTLDDLGAALLRQAAAGVTVQGVFERVGSESVWSELGPLYCAGLEMRQDGNPFLLHHKVFIIDDETVVTGSANFSANGTERQRREPAGHRGPGAGCGLRGGVRAAPGRGQHAAGPGLRLRALRLPRRPRAAF